MSKAQSLIASIKELFSKIEIPQKFTAYTLADGTTTVEIDKLEVGGKVTIPDKTPVAAGTYTLQDGSTVTCDDTGMITSVGAKPVQAAAPIATPPAVAPVTPTPAPVAAAATTDLSTAEGLRKFCEKFATGTPEERITNIETICKAVMEYCFGWQLREAQAKQAADQAITVYKDLVNTNTVATQTNAQLMRQMFDLMQELVAAPAGDPPPSSKKFSFSNMESKNKSLAKFQQAAAKIKELEAVA